MVSAGGIPVFPGLPRMTSDQQTTSKALRTALQSPAERPIQALNESGVYSKYPRYMLYATCVLVAGVVLLSADQNVAAPHLESMANDFFTPICKDEA